MLKSLYCGGGELDRIEGFRYIEVFLVSWVGGMPGSEIASTSSGMTCIEGPGAWV